MFTTLSIAAMICTVIATLVMLVFHVAGAANVSRRQSSGCGWSRRPAYTFNLQEMKSPLVDAVTRAGWDWRPTVWQGPAWLRWLTE